MTRRPESFYQAMREALSGATLRTIADIRDAGESFLARVFASVGELHYNTEGDADAWIEYVDELSGHPGQARLFIPGNILFSLPEEEDTCMVVHPRDIRTRGASYLFHGDGGIADRFPSWFTTAVGIFTKKVLKLQSSGDNVEVDCGSGKKIKLGFSASKGVARQDDHVDCGTLSIALVLGVPTFTYTPPFGLPQTATSVSLVGKVSSSSSKVKAED